MLPVEVAVQYRNDSLLQKRSFTGSMVKSVSRQHEKKVDEIVGDTIEEKNNDYVDDELLSMIFEKSGSSNNHFDQCKVLEQTALENERNLCIFAGAVEILKNQLVEAQKGGACSVCTRKFYSQKDEENCINQLITRINEAEEARDNSTTFNIYHSVKKELLRRKRGEKIMDVQYPDKNGIFTNSEHNKLDSRIALSIRIGSLTEFRSQKAECLHNQCCFACLRDFVGSEVMNYLKHVDRKASYMQELLHVHY